MKTQLKQKYFSPFYYPRLLDKWNQFYQEKQICQGIHCRFLIWCSALETENPVQVLSRCRAGLREDLRGKLFARNVDTLEKAYALVQDLDEARSRKIQDYKSIVSRLDSQPYQSRSTPNSSQPQTDIKDKGVERDVLKSNPQTKYYRCQGYWHIAAKCSGPYKISLIDGEGYPEHEGEKWVHQVDGDEEDFDEDVEESTLNCLQF